jgi:hypothetical protein
MNQHPRQWLHPLHHCSSSCWLLKDQGQQPSMESSSLLWQALHPPCHTSCKLPAYLILQWLGGTKSVADLIPPMRPGSMGGIAWHLGDWSDLHSANFARVGWGRSQNQVPISCRETRRPHYIHVKVHTLISYGPGKHHVKRHRCNQAGATLGHLSFPKSMKRRNQASVKGCTDSATSRLIWQLVPTLAVVHLHSFEPLMSAT